MSKVLRNNGTRITKSLENVDSFILITYDKPNSENTYILRSTVRENKMSLKVLKNSLVIITFQNLYNIDLRNELTGQITLGIWYDSLLK